MIVAAEYDLRCRKLAQRMQELGWDALLGVGLFPEKEGHVAYLTGHRLWTPQWPTSERSRSAGYSFALISGSDNALFAMGAKIGPLNTHLSRLDGGSDPTLSLINYIKEQGIAKIGVAGMDIMPATLFASLIKMGVTCEDADEILFSERLIKSTTEQAILEEGAQLAISAIEHATSNSATCSTPRQIAGVIVNRALALGAEHVLRCRVRAGPETGVVNWPYASTREVENGDAVQVDIVGLHKGYLFDISRVWAIGQPTGETQRGIEAAWKSTHALATAIKLGKTLGEAAKEWRSFMEPQVEGKLQLDGHSIGLDVVEVPWINEASKLRVSDGMVFCIEPSISINEKEEFKIEETLMVSGGRVFIVGK